jgi:aspartate/glutamate racemase
MSGRSDTTAEPATERSKTGCGARRPRVVIVHTSFVAVTQLEDLFREIAPGIEVRHIVDDSLLPELMANCGVTPAMRNRLCEYYKGAEIAGADLVFNACSSVGEVADLAAQMLRIPVIKIDQCMADTACATGRRVGVVATVESTLGPTCRLIESAGRRCGRTVEVSPHLVAGAFEMLVRGEKSAHNREVLRVIAEVSKEVDVVVCAQGSMAAILSDLAGTPVPVLTSPRLGVQNAAAVLARAGFAVQSPS